jgi:hypothetical protein
MRDARLKRIFKNYEETGSLNERVNLHGFIDPHVFLTKTGDLVIRRSRLRMLFASYLLQFGCQQIADTWKTRRLLGRGQPGFGQSFDAVKFLHFFRRLLGIALFSVDPSQNEISLARQRQILLQLDDTFK